MTRLRRRVLAVASVFGLSLLSCGREVTGPTDGIPYGRSRVASLALDPRFPTLPGMPHVASEVAPFDSVRVTLRREDGTVVKDTMVFFPSTADSVTLTLDVPLPFGTPDAGLPLLLSMRYVNAAGDTVFSGGPLSIMAKPSGTPGASAPITIPITYSGPGATAATVELTPASGTVLAGTSTQFVAVARDLQNVVLPGTPVIFSSPDTAAVQITTPGSGLVTWKPRRGPARVIGTLLTNVAADTVLLDVTLPPTQLVLVSGGDQAGTISTALGAPLVFRVAAADGVGVAGVPVTFSVSAGGGVLASLADTSDATGLVSTSWTLGPFVGTQSVTAVATGIAGASRIANATGLTPVPTLLAFTAWPSSAVAGATLPLALVEARDPNGLLASSFSGPVTLTLDAGATGATLLGTTTVNAAGGVATFTSLSIQRAATGLTLIATSGALTPDTSGTLAVAPASPSSLSVVAGEAQSGVVATPLADSLAVRLQDAFANPIAGATINFSVTAGGGSVSPGSAVTGSDGVARTAWTVGATAGAQAARAELNGTPSIFAAFSASSVAGAATQLVVSVQPSTFVSAQVGPPIVVEARDVLGNLATSFTGNITAVVDSGPGGLGVTRVVPAVAGVVSFGDLTFNLAGVYRLRFTAVGLADVVADPLTVLPGAATALATVSGSGQAATVGTVLPSPLTVRVTDALGNRVAGSTVSWAITAGGGSLSVASGSTDVNGETSTTLTLPTIAGVVTVTATAAGLAGSPQTFVATAQATAATQLAFVTQTSSAIAGAPMASGFTVAARDAFGNLNAGFTGAITVALTGGNALAVLGGTLTVSAVAGVATFADLTIDLSASNYQLTATATGLSSTTSALIGVSAASPSSIIVVAGDAQTGVVSSLLADSITVRLRDAFGNVIAGALVDFSVLTGGGTVAPPTAVTNASGEARAAWSVGAAVGAQQLIVTVPGFAGVQVIATATATAGAATTLAIATQPTAGVAGGTMATSSVVARDAAGNLATGFASAISVAVDSGPVGATLSGTLAVPATGGTAAFTTLSLDRAGTYRLRFASTGLSDVLSDLFVITAAAPATITAFLGDGQTASASVVLPDSLGARIVDAFGNPIVGATVTWSVQGGGGVVSPPTSLTDANGVARTRWTLGATVGAQSVGADAFGLPSATFTATASPTDANIVWTGDVDANWSTPGNWSGGVAPVFGDSVRVPAGRPNAPVIVAATYIARLRVEAGATVALDTFQLVVVGTVDVEPGAAITSDSTGMLWLNGSGTLRGTLPRTTLAGTGYTLAGAIAVSGDLLIIAGNLSIDAFGGTVSGSLFTSGSGTLAMTGPAGLVVEGDANFVGGSTAGLLTGGTLTVRGDFNTAGVVDVFSAGPGHTVVLAGTTGQAVTLGNPDVTLANSCSQTCFGTLRSLRSAGQGGVTFGSDAKALTLMELSGDSVYAPGVRLISAGAPAFTSDVVVAQYIGWQTTLTRGAGTFAVDTLIAWGADTALIVGETIPTIVTGQYRVRGAHPGAVIVDGAAAALDVVGRATIGSGTGLAVATGGNGQLIMQDVTDTLVVDGDAFFSGLVVPGNMTAGVLEVSGDLTQFNETGQSFLAEGTHRTRMTGTDASIEFLNPTDNQFVTLELVATSSVTFLSGATITGDVILGPDLSVVGGGGGPVRIGGGLIDSLGARWQVPTTYFDGIDPVLPTNVQGDVILVQGAALDTTLYVNGAVTVEGGMLELNGRRVDAVGGFSTVADGVLRMTNAADSLVVLGPVSFAGGSTAGQLTAGYMELYSDFSQSLNAEAFAASGAHQIWFRNSGPQSITFENPGTGAGTSHFGALGVGQTVGGASVQLLSDVWVDGMLLTSPDVARQFSAPSPVLLTSQGADVTGLSFNNVRWALVDGVPVNTIDSTSFVGQDNTVVQFSITRSAGTIALDNIGFSVVPTTGLYLRVEDPDGATGGALVVNITNPSPAQNGGFLEVIAPATVTGWPNFAAFNWIGVTSSDWNDPGNWLEETVPGVSDSVYIGTGVTTMPVLTASTNVRALVNDNANPVSITNASALGVSERTVLRADTPGLVCTGGGWFYSNAVAVGGPIAARGRIACPFVTQQGTMTLTDSLVVDGPYVVLNGAARVVLAGQTLRTTGYIQTTDDASFVMTNAADLLVGTDATFSTAVGFTTAGLYTAGELQLSGGLSQSGSGTFVTGGTHRTRFLAGAADTADISFTTPSTSGFAEVEIARPVRMTTAVQVTGNALVNYGGSVSGLGRFEVAGDLVGTTGTTVNVKTVELGGAMADTGAFSPDTVVFTGAGQVMPFLVGASAVPQYGAVRITGSVTAGITGAVDSIAGPLIVEGEYAITDAVTPATLRIAGDLSVTGAGRLLSSGAFHQVTVYGNALFDGAAATGDLATGQLSLYGNLTQGATNSSSSLATGPGYSVDFVGDGTILFATPVQSPLGNVDMSMSGVTRTLLSDLNVTGSIDLSTENGTLASDVLAAGGTRYVQSADLSSYSSAGFTLRNVALRTSYMDVDGTLTLQDFDPTAIQIELTAPSGTSFFAGVQFLTTPTGAGRYVRIVDTDAPDGLNHRLSVSSSPAIVPAFHSGFAEAVAPAEINGWPEFPSFTWTGGATTSTWTDPLNWSDNVVPGPADSVFVPDALLYTPSIPAGITLRAFVSGQLGSPIPVDGALVITERLVVPSTSGLACTLGSIEFNNASTPMSVSGRLDCFVRVLDGTLTATDTLTIVGNDLQVEGTSVFDAGADLVTIGSNLSTLAGGRLRMQDDSAHVSVLNGATFGGGATAGLLTAGLLEVAGNFTQSGTADAFAADTGHTTSFSGNVTQQVTFANPGSGGGTSHFGRLELSQTESGVSVQLNNDVFADGALRTGAGFVRKFSSISGPLTVQSRGADVRSLAFDNVRWVLRDGAPVTQMDSLSFSNMDATVVQLDIERTADTVSIVAPVFNAAPASVGRYLRVADADGGGASVFGVSVTTPSPSFHSGFVDVVAPAVLLGWAAAPSIQWTGAVDSNWSTAGNWNLNRLPLATDSVVIDLTGSYAVTINSASTVGWLIVGVSGTPTFTLASGAVLQVDSAALFGTTSTVTMASGSTLTGDGSVSFGGTLNWNGGTMSGAGGSLVVPVATANVASVGGVTLDDRLLVIAGTANFGAAGFGTANAPTISILSGGTLNFIATASYFPGAGALDIVNAGTLRKAASAGTVRIDWPIVNTGTIEVEDETLDLRSTLDHLTGTIAIAPGATLAQGGQVTATAAVTIGDGGSFTLQAGSAVVANPGFHALQVGSSITGAGTFRIVDADTVVVQGNVNVDSLVVGNTLLASFESADTIFVANGGYTGGGFFSGSATIAISGTFSVAAGNPNGTGTFYVAPTGVFSITGGGLRGWDVHVAGTWNWGDVDLSLLAFPATSDYTVVDILATGVLNILHGATNRAMNGWNGSLTTQIFNGGVIRKLTGAATTSFANGMQIANNGTIDVQVGTVNVVAGCSALGTVTGAGTLLGAGCGP